MALAAALACSSLLSCGREITGPRTVGRTAQVSLNPVFAEIRLGGSGEVKSIGSVVDFTRVRVVLLRTNGDTAVDQVVDFPLNSDSVRLALSVTLGQTATRDGETFAATLKYINVTGDTVFTGGPAAVTATLPGSPPAEDPPIPVVYTGRGANAAALVVSPTSFTGTINQTVTFSSVVSDSAQAPMTGVPVAYTSTDSARVSVNLRTGAATLLGARGVALIIAQTLTGQADTAPVTITPTASAILLVSGGNQQVRQGSAFPLPVRVRVNAADGIGLAGASVLFAVTRGQGSPSPAVVVTDALGFAETMWTAGDSAGAALLRASVVGTPLEVIVGGTQLSAAPTSLAFTAQPPNITAGDTIPPFNVLVLDATGDTVSGFTGNVSLDLTGGTAGATLLGNRVVAAVNGVGQFNGLTVDRGGTAYRIRATVAGVTPVQTNTFNVTAAPPRFITVIGGANQTAPASTALPDSVKVRVTNVFGSPVGGVTVNWAIAVGGGTISPATSVTDSLGRAAARWTIGASGTQQITAGVTGLQPVPISASVFVPQGQPTLFIAIENISTTILGTRSVPVFISPAPATSVVATLLMRDTTIAKWTTDSTIFTAGATLRSPSLVGRATGSTYAVVSSSAGTDSLLVQVDSAFVMMSGFPNSYVAAGDTLRKVVYLSEPAPPGGVIVRVVSSRPAAMLVAPGSGRGRPADECDYYCYGLREADEPFRILATPAETAFVAIPAGQLAGQVVLLPLNDDGGDATVSVSATGYAAGSAFFDIEALQLYLASGYSTFGTPFAVGELNQVYVSVGPILTRDLTVRLTSRNPGAVRVDSIATITRQQTGLNVQYAGLSADSTWIVVEAAGTPNDSFFVRVAPAFLNADVSTLTPQVGEREPFNLFTDASPNVFSPYGGPPRATDLTLTLTSSNPAVFVPDFSSVRLPRGQQLVEASIRGVGAGSASLVVTAPGAIPDTIPVTVSAASLSVIEPYFRIGAGQVHSTLYTRFGAGFEAPTSPIEVSVTSSDPNILSVITPQLVVRSSGTSDNATLLGGTPGSVTLTFAAPGIVPVLRTFTVTPPVLVIGTYAGATTIDPDSISRSIFASSTDGFGVARPPADTVRGILRSTDPAVLLVTDSIVRFSPNGSGSGFGGLHRAIAPGTARLILSAPGYVPDTSAIITVRPYRLDVFNSLLTMGRGTEFGITVNRRAPAGRVTPFTVAASGPAGVTVRLPSDTFPAGSTSRTVVALARAGLGVDTLILQSPGLQSDTVRLNVVGSRISPLASYGTLVGQDIEVSAVVRPIGSFSGYAVADSSTFIVQVIDTAMIALIDDSVRVAPSQTVPYRTGLIRFRRPGAGSIRLIDPSGLFAPDSIQLYAYAPSLGGSQSKIFLTMGQSATGGGGYYVYRDYSTTDSVWVRFTSSMPSLVPAPDSVLMRPDESYVYFDLAAGDTVGSARITASAPGYLDEGFDVFVTRGEIEVYQSTIDLNVGLSRGVEVYVINAVTREYTTLAAPLQLRMRSMDPSKAAIGADSVFTIPPEDYVIGPEGVGPMIGVAVGTTEFTIDDPRSASFQRLSPARARLNVVSPRLRTSERILSASVGLSSYNSEFWVSPVAGSDSVWIQLRSVRGRVAFSADSVLSVGSFYFGYFGLTGLNAGLDTVVFTAPGFPPDTVVANVTLGRLIPTGSPPPPLMSVGDSAFVNLYFVGADGSVETLAEPSRTLTFTTPAGLQILHPTTRVPITSIAVTSGATGVGFWVRATSTTGGAVTVSGPGLMTFQRVINTFIRP